MSLNRNPELSSNDQTQNDIEIYNIIKKEFKSKKQLVVEKDKEKKELNNNKSGPRLKSLNSTRIDAFENEKLIIIRVKNKTSKTRKLIKSENLKKDTDGRYTYYCIDKNEILGAGGFGCVYKAFPFDFVNKRIDRSNMFAAKYFNSAEELENKNYKETEGKLLNEFYPTEDPIAIKLEANYKDKLKRDENYNIRGAKTTNLAGISVTQFIPGNDLTKDGNENVIHYRLSNISFGERINIIMKICQQLALLHTPTQSRLAVVHGDIKGSNIKIHRDPKDNTYQVNILDFGCAEEVADDKQYLSHKNPVGTDSHKSPEVISGRIGLKNDIYAMLPVFVALLGGKNIYELGNYQKFTIEGILTDVEFPAFVQEVESEVKSALIQFLNKMQESYNRRPNAAQLLEFFTTLNSLCELTYKPENIEEHGLLLETLRAMASADYFVHDDNEVISAYNKATYDLCLPTSDLVKAQSLYHNRTVWDAIVSEAENKEPYLYFATLMELLDKLKTISTNQEIIKKWNELHIYHDKVYPDEEFITVPNQITRKELIALLNQELEKMHDNAETISHAIVDPTSPAPLLKKLHQEGDPAELKQLRKNVDAQVKNLLKYIENAERTLTKSPVAQLLSEANKIDPEVNNNDDFKTLLERHSKIENADKKANYAMDILNRLNRFKSSMPNAFYRTLHKETFTSMNTAIDNLCNAIEAELTYIRTLDNIKAKKDAYSANLKDNRWSSVAATINTYIDNNRGGSGSVITLNNKIIRLLKSDPSLMMDRVLNGMKMIEFFAKKHPQVYHAVTAALEQEDERENLRLSTLPVIGLPNKIPSPYFSHQISMFAPANKNIQKTPSRPEISTPSKEELDEHIELKHQKR